MRSASNSFVYLLFINKADSLVFLQFMTNGHKLKILSKFEVTMSCSLALAMNRSNLHVYILILHCMIS